MLVVRSRGWAVREYTMATTTLPTQGYFAIEYREKPDRFARGPRARERAGGVRRVPPALFANTSVEAPQPIPPAPDPLTLVPHHCGTLPPDRPARAPPKPNPPAR